MVHRINLATAIGFQFPGFPEHVGPFYVFQGGVEFSAPVFDLTLWNRYRAAQVGVNTARSQEMTVREQSVLLVVSQYLGCQRAAADVAAAQSRVELAQALYDQAADLQRNGVGTGIDTLRSNVELQNEKQRLIVAQTELDTSLFGLGRLLSVDPQRKIEIGDQVQFFQTPAVSLDQTLEHAYAHRPELAEIASQQRQAELERKTAGQDRLPKLSLSGTWLEQGLTPTSIIPVYQYQASLDFPLFTGGAHPGRGNQGRPGSAPAPAAPAGSARPGRAGGEDRHRPARSGARRSGGGQPGSAAGAPGSGTGARPLPGRSGQQHRSDFGRRTPWRAPNDNQIEALYRYNQARADLAHAAGQMEALYAK